MITDLDYLVYKAEDKYLPKQDLANFKSQMFSLEKRLQIYELLSEKETEIFQYIANQLVNEFPTEDEAKIGQALKHWLAVTRYCAMAMLADNHVYLQHRILEWLPEQITAHQLQVIEKSLFNLLQKRLQKILNSEQFTILQPFLTQSQNALLK
jgi:hypothetical protein